MAAVLEIEPQELELDVEGREPQTGARPVIELEQVHKIYTMGDVEVHALRGISLTIMEG